MLGADDFLIVSLPVLAMAVLGAAVARVRPVGRLLALGVWAVYGIMVVSVTLFPIPVDIGYIYHLREIGVHPVHNVLPGLTITTAYTLGTDEFAYQIGGNILLTAPLGFLVPILWSRRETFKGTLWVGFSVTIGLELLQFAASTVLGVSYKSLDVDDVLLNTTGIVVGWLAWRIVKPRGRTRGGWHETLDWLRGNSLSTSDAHT